MYMIVLIGNISQEMGGVKQMGVLKYSYMDHWMMNSPQGLTKPIVRKEFVEWYIRQISSLGFKGFDIFAHSISNYGRMFGSFRNFVGFLQDNGIEKVTGFFAAGRGEGKKTNVLMRECHDAVCKQFEGYCAATEDTGVETIILNPAPTYFQCEPITDEKIHILADLWSRIGEMTLTKFGIKIACHHEFWAGLRDEDVIHKFYEWTDPKYVFFFLDTAQHVIAGVDPIKLYMKLHDRIGGFHLKDTHDVAGPEEYRNPPDSELMVPRVPRWFFEAGTPEGLSDFPRLYQCMKEFGYKGWVGVEHDKAMVGGGNFSECTAVSMWYIRNVLSKIYE